MKLTVMGSRNFLTKALGPELSKKVKVRGGDTALETEKLDQETVDQVFDALVAANFLAFDAEAKEQIKIKDLRNGEVSPEEVTFAAPMAGG